MITFLTIGDFGSNTMIRDKNVEMMNQLKTHSKVDAVLSLGDNFYNYGVQSVHDSQWQDFEASFGTLGLPFYAILGNHDYLGSVKAQLDYSSFNNETIWKMPFRYYDKVFQKGDESVHVFFLDTFTISIDESRACSVAMGMIDFDLLYGVKDTEQYRWLENKLKNSMSTWKVVVGHYPIFSNGHHGNTPELVSDLLPLLKKYDVDFYISGHDHDLEFIRRENMNFIVSGTGCSSNGGGSQSSQGMIYISDRTTFGFNILEFTKDYARFGFFTNHGTPVWYSIPKHKNVHYNK